MSTGSSHVVFLDSHCEVNAGWLEPLLTASLQTPSALISPVLDVIVPQTLQYRRTTELLRAGFGWGLRFRWLPAAAGINSTVQPYR
ncbi:Glycosyltransferase 2-like [Trinorchestia longiramus]|nr:Glycosyltransferase 2-like [Trinorchestia longiramus]